ncbi:hypothetical protein BX616_008183 [Lobosporangium transversale]|uniref:Large ribosomal subunit protein uL23m n=1 Tax=Lobosporangium transversale TaxID=64571 RepID=A0A1Y2H052_9FUNG|nr:hypothetical protein BCR41DRAFT_346769 [Lobosporangium transversale]KAF9896079.1 hypothetical protein BX616_008183 [Lobosporangium transversale]ORZ27424.1 hypothetical protein BCR41DRAFT_346769 [Lobosporangium transversale]|eukprot:XP_021885151.1 hypothetical protein BCR41DRAFT_346769 [Lobosporangium transversale]
MPLLKEGLKKLYFPSTIIKLVRNGANVPEVSNTLTFRVPPSMNKFDIKSYLSNIYNLNVLSVRTANMPVKVAGVGGNTISKRQKFKKAVVTIDHEFKWPDAPDSKTFGIQDAVQERARYMNRLKGWRIRPSQDIQAAKKAAAAATEASSASSTGTATTKETNA